MKKLIALILALAMCALCGCGGNAEETTVPATEAPPATTVPATEVPKAEAPTKAAVVYTNPLTGETLDAPMENRIFAVSINNLDHALPHRGVYKADIYMEMFVNQSIIRGLALYTDIASVDSIGSVRSTRPIFTDIAGIFDAFVAHAGGSAQALTDQYNSNIDNMNIDTGDRTDYSYRDTARTGPYEDTLFCIGAGIRATAEANGVRVTQDPNKTYGLNFTEDGTPANGEDAKNIDITYIYRVQTKKDTTMIYDEATGKYTYNQYGMLMCDADTGAVESFENVLILFAEDHLDETGYHIFDFVGGGDGYYACGGKIIPIKWNCESQTGPFCFTTADGEDLVLGVGSTFIALAPNGSTVAYK